KRDFAGSKAAAPSAPSPTPAPTAKAGSPPASPTPQPAPAAKQAEPDAGRARSSPLARKMAAEKGVDLSKLQGSGPAGRIIQRDIDSATGGAQPSAAKPSPLTMQARVASGQKEVVQLSKMRATIAQRLQQSKQQIPHFYETVEVDV